MAVNDDNSQRGKSCQDLREGLSAMIDGEAGEAEVMALRAHLQECDACETHFQELSILHIRLREELVNPADPEKIWQGVSMALDAEDSRRTGVRVARRAQASGARRWAPLAAAAVLALAVMAGTYDFWPRDFGNLPVVTETNRDFETFRISGRPLDVAAMDPAAIRQWVADRIDFDLPRDLTAPGGFRLAGGRLCSFLNRRLAFFQYQKAGRALSLYVMKATGLELPARAERATVHGAKGLTTVIWRRGELVYLVVSDMPQADVETLARGLIERAGGTRGRQSINRRHDDDKCCSRSA